jgi:hypothetical protein
VKMSSLGLYRYFTLMIQAQVLLLTSSIETISNRKRNAWVEMSDAF